MYKLKEGVFQITSKRLLSLACYSRWSYEWRVNEDKLAKGA